MALRRGKKAEAARGFVKISAMFAVVATKGTVST